MRRVRILLLFAHLHKGGMERVASNLSRALSTDYEQYLGYFGTEHPNFAFSAVMVDFNIPGSRNAGLWHKGISFLRRLVALRRFVRAQKIDVVLSFGEAANVINLASRHSAKRIISVHTAVHRYLAGEGQWGRVYRRAVRLLYSRADLLVAVTSAVVSQLRRDFGFAGHSRVIPNLFNRAEIEALAGVPLPPEFRSVFYGPVLLSVGSLSQEKGHDDLLQAFAVARKILPELQLVVIGDGPLKPALLELAARLEVSDGVHIVGFDSNPYRYMAKATAFVLTSQFEGFSNVLVESMICGTPVIAVDCDFGPREILEGGRWGLLVDQNDVQAIADAMVSVVRDRTLCNQLTALAKERGAAFSTDRVIPIWDESIETVLNVDTVMRQGI